MKTRPTPNRVFGEDHLTHFLVEYRFLDQLCVACFSVKTSNFRYIIYTNATSKEGFGTHAAFAYIV